MRNLRNPFATVAVVGGLLAAGIGVGVQPAFAAAKINGAGVVTCTVASGGSIKIKPGLSATPAVQTIKIKVSATCTSPYGTLSASIKGTVNNPNPAVATSLAGCGTNPVSLTIKWKGGSAKLNTTVLTMSNDYGSAGFFDSPGTGVGVESGCAGTCTITGSFAGESCATHATIGGFTTKKGAIKAVSLSGGTSTIS